MTRTLSEAQVHLLVRARELANHDECTVGRWTTEPDREALAGLVGLGLVAPLGTHCFHVECASTVLRDGHRFGFRSRWEEPLSESERDCLHSIRTREGLPGVATPETVRDSGWSLTTSGPGRAFTPMAEADRIEECVGRRMLEALHEKGAYYEYLGLGYVEYLSDLTHWGHGGTLLGWAERVVERRDAFEHEAWMALPHFTWGHDLVPTDEDPPLGTSRAPSPDEALGDEAQTSTARRAVQALRHLRLLHFRGRDRWYVDPSRRRIEGAEVIS